MAPLTIICRRWPAYQMISSMHIVLMIAMDDKVFQYQDISLKRASVISLEIPILKRKKAWEMFTSCHSRGIAVRLGRHFDVDVLLNSILKIIWRFVSLYHTFTSNWMLQVSETQLANRWGGFYDEMWFSKDVLSVDDCEADETPISYFRYERRGTRRHTYTFWTYILCFY